MLLVSGEGLLHACISSYNKAQLIILAKAVFEMDLQVDPNFDNDKPYTTPKKTNNFA